MQANALGYLRNYPGQRTRAALVAALEAEHPILRMAAASSLRGAEVQTLAGALSDPRRAVRLSALVSMVNAGARPSSPEDRAHFLRVSSEFVEQARLYEDDETTQTDLGMLHLLNGDLERASETLTNSLALDPRQARPMLLLGLVRLGQQRPADARKLFAQVPASDPLYEAAQRQLKGLQKP